MGVSCIFKLGVSNNKRVIVKTYFYSLILFLVMTSTNAISKEPAKLTDMCPALPAKILALEPKYKDFVTVKSSHKEWLKQYKAFSNKLEGFESKYSKELSKVNQDWELLEVKQSPSQKRFYDLIAESSKDALLNEVKSLCWTEIMGDDEFEKDNLCNPLNTPLNSKEWNRVLLCTVERANLLGIGFSN
jgi:hypothetical protein